MRDAASEIPPLQSRSPMRGMWPIPVVLFIIYYVTATFYISDAGSVQPAHAIIIILAGAMAFGLGVSLPDVPEIYWLSGFFLLWTCIVNGSCYLATSDLALLFSSMYFIFNIIVLILSIELRQRYTATFDRALTLTAAFGLVVQIGFVVLSGQLDDAFLERRVGTFTNPNQLGYWTLLNLACFLLVRSGARIGWFEMLVVTLSLVAAALALSKAVIISIGIMLSIVLVTLGLRPRVLLGMVLLALAMVAIQTLDANLLDGSVANRLWQEAGYRVSSIGEQQDDSLDGRGYTRLVDRPEYLVLGAGEGAYYRFDNSLHDEEMHSSFGNLLMSYGIVGVALFVALLMRVLRGAAGYALGLAVPVMLYGLSHQGLRFTWFWIFLGLASTSGCPATRRDKTLPQRAGHGRRA